MLLFWEAPTVMHTLPLAARDAGAACCHGDGGPWASQARQSPRPAAVGAWAQGCGRQGAHNLCACVWMEFLSVQGCVPVYVGVCREFLPVWGWVCLRGRRPCRVACGVCVWSVCLWDAGPEAGWAGGWLVGRGVGSGVLCSERVAPLCHRTFPNLGFFLWQPSRP